MTTEAFVHTSPGETTSSADGAADGGVIDFMRQNIWVPILAALTTVVAVAGISAFIIYRYRRNNRYDYTALHEDLTLRSKIELQKHQEQDAIRDAALLNCSFYLRSSGRYNLVDHLPEIGSRISKQWFLVRDNNTKLEMVLTMVPRSAQMAPPFNTSTKKTLAELFPQLEHPYIFPVRSIDFTVEQEQVVIIQPFNSVGSLKDFMYRSHCCDHWTGKYSFRTKGLPPRQIQQFGLQILHGVLFLEERGYPAYGHLHSGNVMVHNGVCRLSNYENLLLGFTAKMEPMLQSLLRSNRSIIDSLCFGHLLYEMATGFELDAPLPLNSHYEHIEDSTILQLLKFIFDNPKGHPSIREISEHMFFFEVTLAELDAYVRKPVYMSTAMKNLFKSVRKTYPSVKRHHKKKRSSVTLENETGKSPRVKPSVTPRNAKTSSKHSDTSEKSSAGSSKPAPKERKKTKSTAAKSKPEVHDTALPLGTQERNEAKHCVDAEDAGGRSALLADIRRGITLKKVRK